MNMARDATNMARFFLLSLVVSSVAPAAPPRGVPDLVLEGTNGRSYALQRAVKEATFTVFVFFSASCPCMASHDEGLVSLAKAEQPKGVQFFMVDSEVGDALERGRGEATRRQYPFPILADPQARLAQAWGAQFATTTVIVDSEGKVRYRGGIDTARRHPLSAGQAYLLNALSALHEGKSPDPAETKSFGCYLRTS